MVNKTRDKDADRDSGDSKKHRKTIATNSAESTTSKLAKEDIYANVIQFEEEESKKRSAEKDGLLFQQTCDKLKSIFEDIAQLKLQKSAKAQEEIKNKRIQGSFLFAVLKKLNRLDKVRLRAGRDALHKEKLAVDSNKLQLQNLLYEADHLRREVQHCLQFKSRDEEIDLVHEKTFYLEAPKSISKMEETRNDEHARRLARLEWELHQRKDLASKCKNLQSAKENVARDIESKTSRLDSLGPCLEDLLKASKPLQDALEISLDKDLAVQQSAQLLPRPLYVAFTNFSAYADVFKTITDTQIIGNEEEAKELDGIDKIMENEDNNKDAQSQDSSEESKYKMENDDDDDDQENDGQHLAKKHHHRRQQSTTKAEVNIYKPHPLSVTFKLPAVEKHGPSLAITFYYLPALQLVTVQAKLVNFVSVGIAARDVLDPTRILNCLVSNEHDKHEIIHEKVKFKLHRLSVDKSTFLMKLGEQQLGSIFTWAQNICGFNYITSTKTSDSSAAYEITQDSVPAIIEKMQNRLKSRFQLYCQILALEKKNFDDLAPSTRLHPSAKTTCILAQWSPITFEEYMERAAVTQKFIDANLVTAGYLLYHAVIIRGSAKLDCFVSVSPNFPCECPIWAISLNCNGSLSNPSNSNDIKEMEFWINSVELFKRNIPKILVLQLKRAMSSLDVYLETESLNSLMDIKAEKSFLKVFKGRSRSRPYKIVQNGGSIFYTQI